MINMPIPETFTIAISSGLEGFLVIKKTLFDWTIKSLSLVKRFLSIS